MPQYPIPQFIEEEGRIVFFLTFRQFFLLVGGGAVCFILYYTLPRFLFFTASLAIMGGVAVIAFVKVNNVSIITLFLHFLGYSFGTKQYVWKKEGIFSPMAGQEGIGDGEGTAKMQRSRLADTKKDMETR